jgi:hypothetical protein
MPSWNPVAREELSSAGSRQADDVLEIRRGRGDRSNRRRVERPADDGEGENTKRAARHLEPARGNVLVWHPVAEEVQDRPDDDGAHARAGEQTADCTGGDVHRDDHTGKNRWLMPSRVPA